MKRTVIGITGGVGSGKGVVSDFLSEKGFVVYSLSNSIRKILEDVGLSKEREVMAKLGNSLRERFGNDVLAKGAKNWVESQTAEKIAIESIRNPDEVLYLQKELNALIVGITMSPEKGFELTLKRGRPGDPTNWEEYLELLAKEEGKGEKESGHNLKRCMELADIEIPNEGTIEDLKRNLASLLAFKGIFLEGTSHSTERK